MGQLQAVAATLPNRAPHYMTKRSLGTWQHATARAYKDAHSKAYGLRNETPFWLLR